MPVPLAAKPVAVLLFVQLNVAPEGELLKFIAETVAPEQIAWLEGKITEGVGLTVIVNEVPALEQLFNVGTTVIVETCCAETFDAVIATILPVPVAEMPVAVLLFVQENVAPKGILEKVVAAIVELPQIV